MLISESVPIKNIAFEQSIPAAMFTDLKKRFLAVYKEKTYRFFMTVLTHMHCNENPLYAFLFWEASAPISTLMYL
jgi:hypothetical protein